MDTIVVDGVIEHETIIGGIDRDPAAPGVAPIIMDVILGNIVPIRVIHVHSMLVVVINLIRQDSNVLWFGS